MVEQLKEYSYEWKSVFGNDLSLYGKEGLLYRLSLAHGAFAGPGEPVSLSEYEAALTALGGSDYKLQSLPLEAPLYVAQVLADLLLADANVYGDVPGGKGAALEHRHYLLPYRLRPVGGNGGFFLTLFRAHSTIILPGRFTFQEFLG